MYSVITAVGVHSSRARLVPRQCLGGLCLAFIRYLFLHGQVHPTDKFFMAEGSDVKYDSSEGCPLCSRILARYLPYDGICMGLIIIDLARQFAYIQFVGSWNHVPTTTTLNTLHN